MNSQRHITRWLLVFICLLGANIAFADTAYDQAIATWDKVLMEFVDEQGRTDFKALATKRKDIDFVVSVIANFGPNSNPEYFDSEEKILAYHINTYNVLAMHGVIEEGIESNASIAQVAVLHLQDFGAIYVGADGFSVDCDLQLVA